MRRTPARRRAPARRRVARRTGSGCGSGESSPGQKFLIANADPFNPLCQGAKIPDANTVQSVGYPMSELSTLSLALASDVRCFAFLPAVSASIITSTGGAAGWTWPANYAGATSWSKRSSVVSTMELFRPVAHGIRISCPNAPTSTTGFVHIAVAYETFRGDITWPWATDIAGISGYQQYKRVTLASLTQSPLTIINKYTDETAFRYTSTSAADNPTSAGTGANPFEFNLPYSWGAILIAVEGAATTSPLVVESVLHSEGIPKQSSFLMGGLAAAYSPQILGATSNMVSKTEMGYMESERESYLATAYREASAGASAAMSSMGSQVLGHVQGAAYRSTIGLANMGLRYLYGQARRAYGGGSGLPGINSDPNRLALTR